MKLFIDTANVEEIKEINELGIICGVTTNPTLIARSGRDFEEVIKEISEILDGPISAEVISTDRNGMIDEARELSKIHSNIVIKIPMTKEGLAAVKVLDGEGIKTNVTLVFSTQQALLAARAGATYVSPFIGRLEDIGGDGIGLIEDIADMYETYDIDTEIIAASIRSPKHVLDSAMVGSDIATIPYGVLLDMFHHPLTDSGLEAFIEDWNEFKSR